MDAALFALGAWGASWTAVPGQSRRRDGDQTRPNCQSERTCPRNGSRDGHARTLFLSSAWPACSSVSSLVFAHKLPHRSGRITATVAALHEDGGTPPRKEKNCGRPPCMSCVGVCTSGHEHQPAYPPGDESSLVPRPSSLVCCAFARSRAPNARLIALAPVARPRSDLSVVILPPTSVPETLHVCTGSRQFIPI